MALFARVREPGGGVAGPVETDTIRDMNFPNRPMASEEVHRRILELQVEHRDLDLAIERLALQSGVDELQLRRLKKRKLLIKDTLALLQMQLVPDVPA